MNTVRGRVVVTETGRGVGQLVVELWDIDARNANTNIASNLSTLSNDNAAAGVQAFDRLGSAVTDPSGHFQIDYDDQAFRRGDNEQRPDLFFTVLAPADTQEDREARPWAQRLLHRSDRPIPQAGRSEETIIRIPRKQIDALGLIEVSPELHTTMMAVSSHAAINDVVTATMTPRLTETVAARTDRRTAAARAFEGFVGAGIREHLRNPAFFLRDGDDLPTRMEDAVHDALARARSASRRLHLYPLPDDRNAMGLSASTGGRVRRSAVLAHLDRVFPDIELYNHTRPLGACRRMLEAHRTLHPDSPVTSSPGASSRAPVTDTDSFVREQIGVQLSTVTVPEEELRYGVHTDPGQDIQDLSIRTGPADAEAIHDFHDIQLAFQHLWTRLEDAQIKDLAEKLLAESMRLKDESDGDLEDADMYHTWDDIIRLRDQLGDDREELEQLEEVPEGIAKWFPECSRLIWNLLESGERFALRAHALAAQVAHDEDHPRRNYKPPEYWQRLGREVLKRAATSDNRFSRFDRMMLELSQRISEPHTFDVFAPNSVNYGVLLTYRQRWNPLAYQVGSLVSTVPLAPKEKRSYSKTTITRESRNRKEVHDNLRVKKTEEQTTARTESEIVRRAQQETRFQQTAEMQASMGAYQFGGNTSFGRNASKESARTKRNFRESVVRAAEEYRQQHRIEVETQHSLEITETTEGEISNPNDEITVTYLFYELQRRFNISERLHRATPVILVANDVPSPDAIDEDWIISNDWILRRSLLDDSFQKALDYLREGWASDAVQVDALRAAKEKIEKLVEELRDDVRTQEQHIENTFNTMSTLSDINAARTEAENVADIGLQVMAGPFAGLMDLGGDDESGTEQMTEFAQTTLDRLEKQARELRSRLDRQVEALQKATERYVEAERNLTQKRVAITRLRVHLKQNILYYMQAIWDHEPPDQRYFRLYDLEVPWVAPDGDPELMLDPFDDLIEQIDEDSDRAALLTGLPLDDVKVETRRLGEIADLNRPLGYKGNYAIYPLRERDYLTTWMAQDYVDERIGVRDPDEMSNLSLEDLLDYMRCLQALREEDYRSREERLEAHYRNLAVRGATSSEVVVVPSDSLYIEALPGTHALIEDFKRVHRALDVKKVQAEVRFGELENVRLAARLLEAEREDPQVDKRVQIQGGNGVIVSEE